MSEQARLAYEAAQHPAGPSPSAAAHADQQARLAADEAQLRTGGPHSDEILSHHEGRPTVAEQMVTHGAAPPRVPDTGGHG
jgi:hypothetical protein